MDRMQKSMTVYVKSLSERAQGADREKMLPGGHLGSSMVSHSEDFEPDSEFGNCLSGASACTSPKPPATHTNTSQRSAEQMSAWRASRRRMFRVPPPRGSKAWTAPWPR